MTVRDRIKKAQMVLSHGTPELSIARDIYAELSALTGNCQDELRAADAEYDGQLFRDVEDCGSVAKGTIKSRLSPQWARKREAEDVLALNERLVKTLDRLVFSMGMELKHTP